MKTKKRTQNLKCRKANKLRWQVICNKCYRKHYCGLNLDAEQCILFRLPEDADKDYQLKLKK